MDMSWVHIPLSLSSPKRYLRRISWNESHVLDVSLVALIAADLVDVWANTAGVKWQLYQIRRKDVFIFGLMMLTFLSSLHYYLVSSVAFVFTSLENKIA